MFDGAGAATAAHAMAKPADAPHHSADHAQGHSDAGSGPVDGHVAVAPAFDSGAHGGHEHGHTLAPATAATTDDAAPSPRQIAFVASSLPDLQNLLKSIGPSVEVVLIDPTRNGMDQIAAALTGQTDISAIHILSHGTDANLYIGTADLNATTMTTTYAADLAVIKQALAPNADILIYGCDFAANPDGNAAVQELAQLTGATVAASTDVTGAAAKGGNWVLEDQTGALSVATIDAAAWNGTLNDTVTAANLTISGGSTAFSGSLSALATDSISGATLTFSPGSTGPSDGSVTVNADGTYLYVAKSGFTGQDTFTYHVVDGNAVSADGLVTVNVGANVSVQVNDGQSATIDAASHIVDPTGTPTNFTATGLPTGLSIDANGQITGTVDRNASTGGVSGSYLVTVTGSDASGDVFTQQFTIVSRNQSPVLGTATAAVSVSDAAASNPITSVDTSTAFSDPNGDPLTFAATNLPTGLSINATTGVISGTLDPHEAAGTATATVTATDRKGASASESLAFDVTGDFQTLPTSSAVTVYTLQTINAATASTFADTLPGATIASYSASGLPSGLSIDSSTGVISGKIASVAAVGGTNASGSYDVSLSATDSLGNTRSYTQTWKVVADQITATNDFASTYVGHTLSDTVATHVTDTNPTVGITFSLGSLAPTHGVAKVNTDGTFTYTPNAGYLGSDSFSYHIVNSDGLTGDSVVTVNVAAPVVTATDHTDSTPFNTALGGTLKGLATSQDGGAVTYQDLSNPADGTVTVNSDGTFTYTPNTGFVGTDTFTYVATNSYNRQGQATETVTVTSPTPTVVADAKSTAFDTVLTASVAGDASDAAKLTLTYAVGTEPTHGTVTMDPKTGAYTYAPDPTFSGKDTFTFTATDPYGVSATATVTVTVGPHIDTAVINVNDGQFNTPIQSATYFQETLSATTTFTATGLPTGLSIDSSTGIISGTLDHNASTGGTKGVYTVVVTTTDANGNPVAEQITIDAHNQAPNLVSPTPDQAVTDNQLIDPTTLKSTNPITPVDASLAFVDPNSGDVLTYSASGLPKGLSIDAKTGIITGTLDPHDAAGTTAVVITATDNKGLSTTETFNFVVTGYFQALPVGTQTFFNGMPASGIPAATLPPATFVDTIPHDTITSYTATGLPTGLTLDATTGKITGTISPTASLGGPNSDGIYQITWSATDTAGATVTWNQAWVIQDKVPAASGRYITDQVSLADQTITPVDVSSVFATKYSADTLTYSATGLPTGLTIDPTTGVISGTVDPTIANGTQYNVRIIATDPAGSTATQSFHWLIDANGVVTQGVLPNQSVNDSQTLSIATASGFVTQPGTTLTYSATGLPVGLQIDPTTGVISGTIEHNASIDGSSVSQNGNFSKLNGYAITVSVVDSNGDKAAQSFVLQSANQAPTLTSPTPDQPVAVRTALGIDTSKAFVDPNTGDTVTYASTALPTGLSIKGTTGVISGSIDPHVGTGVYSVTITATDNKGAATKETFNLDVTNPAGAHPQDPSLGITAGTIYVNSSNDALTVTGADPNPGATDTYTLATPPANGTITTTTDASGKPIWTYTPKAGFTGTDTYSATITDQYGLSRTQTFSVNVVPVPKNAIVAVDDFAIGTSATATVSGSLTSDVFNGASGTPTFTLVSGPGTGSFTLNTNGTYSFTPDPTQSGPFSFVWKATNAAGKSATGTETIYTPGQITAASDAEITPFDTTFQSGTTHSLATLTSDPAHPALTYSIVDSPAHGTLVLNPDGSYAYTPNTGWSGADTFEYFVDNGVGNRLSNFVTIVTGTKPIPGDTPPTAVDDKFVTEVNTSHSGTVAPDVTVAAGDTSTFILFKGASDGTVTLKSDGTYTYTPKAGYTGPDKFTYLVDDGKGGQAVATVSITVAAPPVATPDDIGHTNRNTPLTVNGSDLVASTFGGADTDPQGYPLTVSAVSAKSSQGGGVVLDANGTVTYTPPAGFTGTDTYTYTVSDGYGGAASTTVTVHVDGAFTGGTASQSGHDGQPITAIATKPTFTDTWLGATDTNFAVTGGALPLGLALNSKTGIISGTLDHDASSAMPAGGYQVTVTATDSQGHLASSVITITSVNDAPVVATTPHEASVTNTAISPVDLSSAFSDPNTGDTMTFVASGLPNGLVMNSNGVVIGTPTTPGTYTVTVTATDEKGAATPETFTWIVGNFVGGNAARSGHDGLPITSIDSAATFTDVWPGGVAQSYAITSGALPSGLAFDTKTGVISGTLGHDDSKVMPAGGYQLTVTATDNQGHTANSYITITSINDAPVVGTATTDQSTVTGTTIAPVDTSKAFSDPNPGDGVTYSVTGLPPGLVLDKTTGVVTGAPTTPGNYSVVVTATDDKGAATPETFVWQVGTITGSTASRSGHDGEPITPIATLPTFTDTWPGSGPTGFAITGGALPLGLSLDPHTGVISGTLDHDASKAMPAGGYQVTITANDNGHTASSVITITSVNDAPVLTSRTLDQTGTVGSRAVEVDTSKAFSDANTGDVNTYTAVGLPNGLSIDPKTGIVSGTFASSLTPGVYTATITVTDDKGATATETVTWSVKAAPVNVFAASASVDFTQSPVALVESSVQSLSLGGIVLAAVGQLGPEVAHTGLDTDHPVSGAVNGISPLLGTGGVISGIRGLPDGDRQPIAWLIDDIRHPLARTSDQFTRQSGTWTPQGLTGFSLHFDLEHDGHAVAPGEQPRGRLVIESLVRERMLYIQMKHLFSLDEIAADTNGLDVERYDVMQADGSPLPVWLGPGGKGLVLGERPADVDRIELRIEAVFNDGTRATRFVTVDSNSGEIEPLAQQQRSEIERPALFSRQLAERNSPSTDTGALASLLAE